MALNYVLEIFSKTLVFSEIISALREIDHSVYIIYYMHIVHGILTRNAILLFRRPSDRTKSEDIASEHTEGSVQ